MSELGEHSLPILQAEGYPSPEWFAKHRPVEEFLIPNWQPHPERLLPNYDVRRTHPKWLGSDLDLVRLVGTNGIYNPNVTVLDVGGGNGGEPLSPLRTAPFYYILDPTVGEVSPIHPHRVQKGYAEDMPFRDKSFYWVLSDKAVGWYPDVINPYWALREMIRVAQERVNITIGQEEKNEALLLKALEEIRNTPEGQRIRREAIKPTELALLLDP